MRLKSAPRRWLGGSRVAQPGPHLERKGAPTQASDLLRHDLVGGDSNTEIDAGFQAMGFAPAQLRFALRTDNLNAQWAAVRAGLGVGFMGHYLIQSDAGVLPLLPALKLPSLPIWLTVHRELRTSARIRAVYDFLAAQLPLGTAA